MWYHLYTESKIWYKWTYLQNRKRLREGIYGCQGKGIGEGNGNPLQCSCLENPRDGGAWWAAVYGVTKSRTRLKRLSSSSSRELEIDIYILQITNKDLLYITWNSAQCCGSLDGRGVWGRMDTCICVTESLHCSPETITTLLISYTPIQNKKFVFKNDYTYMYIHTYIHIHTHNRILLSHKNEWNNAICNNMDGPRECHTEWNKSERETMWCHLYTEPKIWHKWTYILNRNRLT